MRPAIEVENIAKRYLLGHQVERQATFRDVIKNSFRQAGKRILAPKTETPAKEEFWALKNISFEVQPGERIGFIGRNGAGKSTLLKILSRITEPTQGQITLRGRLASLLEVGTGFHPELTGRENIFLNGSILGMRRQEIRRKFDEIVAFAEVERFLDLPVKRYSSGMYVRLAFAVAAHLEPDVLIVDEVLAVGDAQFQKKCMGKMEEAGSNGRTVLFVSHNMTAIRSLCTRAIVLRNGEISYNGRVSEAIDSYIEDNRTNTFTVAWTEAKAPRNNGVSLVSATILGEGSTPVDQLSTDDAFNVEIVYRVLQPETHAGMTLIMYDVENNCVFSSINNFEPNWYGKPMPVGLYRTICTVPAKLLNYGWYYFNLNFFERGYSDACLVKEMLKFEIFDGPGLRNDYYGPWLGAVRPTLAWTTQPLLNSGKI